MRKMMMTKAYLVRQSCWLTHDPERERLFITESFQMTADARALYLPLPQVIRKPEHTHIRSEQTETHWACLHTCKCLNCVLLQGEDHRGYWHSVSLFNVRSNFDIRKMWNAHDFSRKHGCLAVAETECVYLRLKASRCVLSSSSPLSIMVRLEWASFSRLADAIIKLSIHLLMNSCSFSRPVLPAVTHTNKYITLHTHIFRTQNKKHNHQTPMGQIADLIYATKWCKNICHQNQNSILIYQSILVVWNKKYVSYNQCYFSIIIVFINFLLVFKFKI